MMAEFDHSPWQLINPDLSVYRFDGGGGYLARTAFPILMLHGPMTSHRTWDTLAFYLWQQGLTGLYAVDIADVQMGASLRPATTFLRRVINWLSEDYAHESQLALIGHSTGGVLARRYLLKVPEADRVSHIFTLGSPHTHTHYSYQVYVPPINATTETQDESSSPSLVRTTQLPNQTIAVNIFGNGVGNYFDGAVHGVFLPEAVNIVMRLEHAELKHHPTVMEEVMAYFRGHRYRMQIFLQSLTMKTPDTDDDVVGPFYFEVNGMRTPFSGIFQAVAEQQYSFDNNSTPLATLAHDGQQALVSTVFRLKDLSRTRATRRRLFAKLLDSLSAYQTTVHELQDNEGSNIVLRVETQHIPPIIPEDN